MCEQGPGGGGGGGGGDGGSLLEGAVPTLRLDPAVRAAVLAVAPPAHAHSQQHGHATAPALTGRYFIL